MSSLRVERRGAVSVLTLDRPKAKALDRALIEELREALRQCADSGRGIVLASSHATIFSAGWDLPALVSSSRQEMEDFLRAFLALVREVFVLERPVVAALPGHAIAGGLILAAAADERIASEGKGEFGLSEAQLGLPVPFACLEIFRHAIGFRETEKLATTGERLSTEKALAIGLLDRLVPPGELLERALERAHFLAGVPSAAFAAVKSRLRRDAVSRFDEAAGRDPFLDFWFAPEARSRISSLVERLTRKKEGSLVS